MKTKRWLGCWQLRFVGLLTSIGISIFANKALAQSTPSNIQADDTLGTESSQIIQNFQGQPREVITGGATRGINLFHSFQEFNVNEGREAYFFSPSADIQNILARVTGGNRSEILGTLGTVGNSQPNLFLINPNGIIFGGNARLDVPGAFVGTTANGVQFGEQGLFSATNPQAPALLTVNPSALFFNQMNRSEIINRSRQIATPGSFYLIGGNITFDGGIAISVGNRLEFGAVALTGTVELIGSGNQMQLAFREGVPKADIVLQNNALASTTGGGAVSVNAENLSLFGNSIIGSVLAAGEGQLGVAGGDVVVNATGNVTLDDRSSIANQGLENSLGDTGNITVNAQSIRLTNQSQISSPSPRSRGNINLNAKDNISLDNSLISTNGILNRIGKSGNLTIAARNINLSNRSIIDSGNIGQGQSGKIDLKAQETISMTGGSTILSASTASGFGELNNQPSGDIEIKTRNLTLDGNNTSINASNLDEGRGGNVRIIADDSISLNELASISSTSTGQGDAGNIELQTRSLTLANGGSLGTQSSGRGSSGNLLINASDSVNLSGITTFINPQTGETITTGSRLATSTFGTENSGKLTINTQRLSVNDGGDITTSTEFGRGGNLTINAKDSVEVVGRSPSTDNSPSTISTSTFGSGDAGNLSIITGRLSIRDGGAITTLTSGTGKGGNLTVDANDSVEVVGRSPSLPNGLSNISTGTFGFGNAGSMRINTNHFSVRDGARVTTSTFSRGKGGHLTVNADRSVELIGTSSDGRFFSGLLSSAESGSIGDAGDLTITTQNLLVRDGAQINTGTSGAGKGGNLTINTSNKVQLTGTSSDRRFVSSLGTSTNNQDSTGDAGNLMITTQDLIIQNGALVTSATSGAGKGGNLTVNASGSVEVMSASRLSASTNQGLTGNAGDLTINTQNLLVRDGGQVDAVTFGARNGGNLIINASKKVEVIGTSADGQTTSVLSTSALRGSTGDAGNLKITTQDLLVRDGAQIDASTNGRGKGGNLTVDASNKVQLIGTSADGRVISGLATSAQAGLTGDAGSLTVNTQDLLVRDGARIFTGTFGTGRAGNLTVNASNKVELVGTSADGFPGGLIASAERGSTGNAGDLKVDTQNLIVRDGAQVLASTFSSGRGGNLTVNASESVQLMGQSANSDFLSGLFASSEKGATGSAGNLAVNTQRLLARDGAQVIASTFNSGQAGDLTLNASESVQLIGQSARGGFSSGLFVSAERDSTGNAGDLKVNTRQLLVRDRAGIFVNSQGTGNAGIMTINANTIRLDNNASLNANTRSPNKDPNREQATINLNSRNIVLRRNSNITTNASGENVVGGNINIDSDFLIAIANSDISANSTDFRGGNVRIKTQSIFGTQFRDAPTSVSDITATGATRDLSGNVEISPPDVDLTSGLVELPINLVDASNQIYTACTPGTRQFQNTFISTGRGGLPLNPIEPLQDANTIAQWVRLRSPLNAQTTQSPLIADRDSRSSKRQQQRENSANTAPQSTDVSSTTKVTAATQIVEAQSWVVDRNGNIELVVQAPSVTPHNSWFPRASCPVGWLD
ncbi:filamentous hemagglutinin N-terminal domain-containing protein [Scytonema sp. UIC 10036]|uniref:beta strand repeat-containing protein n=1 Tax=Scytonema sp. UIC 10036 TaxID=2304196 RepID=UPI0012DA0499|nr:filamentous hemagglutinin N-terminal domain-containing protein [Scytonema sp. UIC 10036]MUG91175.1 filamentous hemagglutinin N-terminal domain-containing protein [Scytonema sp. UIC 10036]